MQSEYSAQTTTYRPWITWLLNLLKVIVVCLALIGAYQSCRSVYYRCFAKKAPQLAASTVAYAAPADQLKDVVATTRDVEHKNGAGAGPTMGGQPSSAATQSLAGKSEPIPYLSSQAPSSQHI